MADLWRDFSFGSESMLFLANLNMNFMEVDIYTMVCSLKTPALLDLPDILL